MGALDLAKGVTKGALATAKKTGPFFSKADIVLDELQRGKGTGNEFLTEMVKKGAKPTELRERGIEQKLKDMPKVSKAEVKKVFEENPAPKVEEKVFTDKSPDYDEFLEQKALELYGEDYWKLARDERQRIDKMYDQIPVTKYEQYKTPGGENYREILLKLPEVKGQTPFASSHWVGEPNVLAHIRVQDFQMPQSGYMVVNTRSGNKSQVFGTAEEAQQYLSTLPASLQPSLKIQQGAGQPKKVLLVDEIQSDWHQAGRRQGYSAGDATKAYADYEQGLKPRTLDKITEMFTEEGVEPVRARELAEKQLKTILAMSQENRLGPYNMAKILGEEDKISELWKAATAEKGKIPDAPFKKNWHELAMKRVLDYAAENGYDTVAITPGAEQAKRYDLSKHVDTITYHPESQTLKAFDKDLNKVIDKTGVKPEDLSDMVGKDVAQRLIESPIKESTGHHSLSGQDLQVGGEGMKGFYDKMLPDYLNNLGKQYGASVRQEPLRYVPSAERVKQGEEADALLGQLGVETPAVQPTPYHMFDITPQLREEIKAKGLPMYSKIGMGPEGLAAGTGAATIGADALSGGDEQQVQNPVHFTENPDVMLLDLMQRN